MLVVRSQLRTALYVAQQQAQDPCKVDHALFN
jgi:hypothetical protein